MNLLTLRANAFHHAQRGKYIRLSLRKGTSYFYGLVGDVGVLVFEKTVTTVLPSLPVFDQVKDSQFAELLE